MRWTTQTSGTVELALASDAAGNVAVHLALSGFLPPPGTVEHEDTHALRLRVEHPVVAANGLSRHLAAVSSEESEGGEAGTSRQGGAGRGAGGGGASEQGWPAERRGVHGGLTWRRPSPRRTHAERSKGPAPVLTRLPLNPDPAPQPTGWPSQEAPHHPRLGHTISHRRVSGQPIPCTITPLTTTLPCAPGPPHAASRALAGQRWSRDPPTWRPAQRTPSERPRAPQMVLRRRRLPGSPRGDSEPGT